MTEAEIKDFQKQDRLEQLRRLVKDRIVNNGYTLTDFKKEYYVSEKDIEDFKIVEAESR